MLSVAVGPDAVIDELNEDNGLFDNMVRRVVVSDDHTNDIYIGTSNGTSVYDYIEGEFVSHINLSIGRRSALQDMVAAKFGGVYIVTNDYPYPVKYYNRLDTSMLLENVTFNNQFNRTMGDTGLTAISVSSNGTVFCIGFAGGIAVYNRNTHTLTEYNTTNGLTYDSVSCILRATVSNRDWFFIGTYEGGISIFDTSDSTFINFDALGSGNIGSDVEAMLFDAGTLYVGTNDQGVFGFDITSTEATEKDELRLTASNAWLPINSIHSLDIDGTQLYIGTHLGLVKYDLVEQESWSTYTLDESNDLPDNPVMSLAIVDSGATQAKLFAGTKQGGVAVISINYELSDRERALSEQPLLERIDVQLGILIAVITIGGYILKKVSDGGSGGYDEW